MTDHTSTWKKLHEYEATYQRGARMSKVKNPIIAILYLAAVLWLTVSLVQFRIGEQSDFLYNVPVLGDCIRTFLGEEMPGFWSLLWDSICLVGLIPMVFGIILHVVLSIFIWKRDIQPDKLTGDEQQQRQTMLAQCRRIPEQYHYCDPSLFAAGTALIIVGLGYVAYLVIMIASGASGLFWLSGLVLAVILAVVVELLGILPLLACSLPPVNEVQQQLEKPAPKPEPKPEPKPAPRPAPVKAEPKEEKAPIHLRPDQWDLAFVRANTDRCAETALEYVNVAKEALKEREYSLASTALSGSCLALLQLIEVSGGEKYMPAHYANLYALSRVYAFGLQDRDESLVWLRRAVQAAGKCAISDTLPDETTSRALRDMKIMKDVLADYEAGASLSTLRKYYLENFPYDIING